MRDDLSIIIKTFERPSSLRLLLESIERRVPGVPVIIADDSERPYAREVARLAGVADRTRVLELPFDSGCGPGRNAAVAAVETPWFVNMDDDFIVLPETDLDHMLRTAQQHRLAVGDGLVYRDRAEGRVLEGWNAWMHQPCRTVVVWEPVGRIETPVTRCDLTCCFVVGHTESIRAMPQWFGPDMKTAEHIDMFMNLKAAGLPVGLIPDARVFDAQPRSTRYKQFRNRGEHYRQVMMERRELSHMLLPNGSWALRKENWDTGGHRPRVPAPATTAP